MHDGYQLEMQSKEMKPRCQKEQKQPESELNLSVHQPIDKERKCGTYMQWNMT